MMSWRWLLWLIPVYLVVLVVIAPARIALWFVGGGGGPGAAPLSSPLTITAISGTIWHGEVSFNAELPTGGSLTLNDVEWRLNPWQLFTGQANIALKIPSSNLIYGEAVIVASASDAQLQGDFRGAMQPAIQQLRIPVPITVAGNFELAVANYQVSDFASGKLCDTLDATFNTRSTEMRLNQQWYALGDYQTQLNCNEQNGINARIDDNNLVGLRLNAQVNGRITAPEVSLEGSMRPTVNTPKPVTDMLVFLGKPDAQGRYNFKW